MTEISNAQIQLIKIMIRKQGMESELMATSFSLGRTTHISELTCEEARQLIIHLKSLDKDEVAADKMRKKLLSLGYQYHGLTDKATKGEKVEAAKHVEAWVEKYGHVGKNGKHKKLDSYTVKELPKLISQFEQVYQQFLEKI